MFASRVILPFIFIDIHSRLRVLFLKNREVYFFMTEAFICICCDRDQERVGCSLYRASFIADDEKSISHNKGTGKESIL